MADDVRRLAHGPRGNTGDDRAGRDVLAHDATRGDQSPFTDFDAGEDHRRRPDDRRAPDRRPFRARVRRGMRIVEKHGAREDPDELLDRREVRDEDAAVQAGVVADRQVPLEVAVGADANAVPDARALADLHVMAALEPGSDLDVRVDDGVTSDQSSFADTACVEEAEGLNRGAVSNDCIRAYDARLVDDSCHRTMIRPTAVRGVDVHALTLARDERGALAALELADCPFEAKRIFTVYDVPSESVRGAHAHRVCHQFLVCVAGRLTCLVDDGVSSDKVEMDGPSIAIHIPPLVWGTQWQYTRNAVLLVLASHPYDAEDYIRNYDEFLELVRP